MKRIIAISLLFIFLAGQLNLTWASHFCGDFKVKSTVMLGVGNLDCGMEEKQSCDMQEKTETSKNCIKVSCCENEYYSADIDDFFHASENSIAPLVLFAHTFLLFSFNNFSYEREQVYDNSTSPPLIRADKQVWNQTFII